ncbi:MAG: ribonuclease P protein component [bacterium]|nr:ribonuclease P protein component [bacterium]
MSESFAQHERIKRKTDFQRVYSQGKKKVSSSFILYSYIEEGRSYCRLGITASRKVGNAVARNRCKRMLREIFRQHKTLFPQGVDFVVVVRRTMVGKRYNEVLKEFCRVL